MTACDDCLRRTDLIAALAGRLQVEFKQRTAPGRVLALPDEELLELGAPEVRRRYSAFDAPAARGPGVGGRVEDRLPLPRRLPRAAARPRRSAGGPARARVGRPRSQSEDAIAVVGARRASSYGLEVARALGRGLSAARVPVVSGLALGVDSAAHAGALEARGQHDRRARRERPRRPIRRAVGGCTRRSRSAER